MKRLGYFLPIIIMLMIIIFFVKGLKQNPQLLPSTLINKNAPAFQLPSLEAPTQTYDQSIFQNHITLLNVWASWCKTCSEESKYLMQFHQQHPEIQLIGLDYKDQHDAALKWLNINGDPYQIILDDSKGSTAIDYGVYGTPENFLINAQGVIIAKHVGVMNETIWASEFEPALQKTQEP